MNTSYLKDKLQHLRQLQVDGRHERPQMQMDDYPVQFCQNCGMEYHGNYCPHCGQSAKTSRLTLRTAFSQAFSSVVNLERGFVRTCVELYYRPGYMIRDYIEGRRADYHKPVSMLFMLATVHIIVHYIFFQNSGVQFQGYDIDTEVSESLTRLMQVMLQAINYMLSNQALATLLFVFFIVFPNWFVFKLTQYGRSLNLAEHFYIMLFIGCQLMIFNILQIPYNFFSGTQESAFAFTSSYSYLFAIIDFKQLYQIGWWKSIGLFLLTSFVAFILFLITVIVLIWVYIKFINPDLISEISS